LRTQLWLNKNGIDDGDGGEDIAVDDKGNDVFL
jgi:hypothetical protein